MKYIELSIEELVRECRNWIKDIEKSYCPDMVIYVAKAGYLIGQAFVHELGSVPLVAIGAERRGNGLKSKLHKYLAIIPFRLRNILIFIELKTNIHKAKKERNVDFISDVTPYINSGIKRILLVDDSVDTGYSIKQVKDKVAEVFPNSEIRTASLNVWDKSKEIVQVEYALYHNVIIKAPMSKDSKEYNEFVGLYNKSLLQG